MFDVVKSSAMYYSDFLFKIINEQLIPMIIKFNFNTHLEFFPRLELDEPDFELMMLAIKNEFRLDPAWFTERGIPVNGDLPSKSGDDEEEEEEGANAVFPFGVK